VIDTGTIQAFVLAGGASSRFGSDKALASWRGRPLLAWAIDAARSLGLSPAIVSPRVEAYRAHASAFITDERPDRGPSEGLRAALGVCPTEWALVLSVDMPRIDGRALRALCAAATAEDRAVCFVDPSGRRHPFPGLYRRAMKAMLDAQEAPVPLQRVLDDAPAKLVEVASIDPSGAILRNVNRREDLVDDASA
jgi:molybdopterin-guanine dinucleotide biosynthesis protein A